MPSPEVQQQPPAVRGSAVEAPVSQPREPIVVSKAHENGGLESYSGEKKTPEDIKEEALVKEIVHKDKSLAGILDPDAKMKTTMDLMEGLFPSGPRMLKENKRRKVTQKRTAGHSTLQGDKYVPSSFMPTFHAVLLPPLPFQHFNFVSGEVKVRRSIWCSG